MAFHDSQRVIPAAETLRVANQGYPTFRILFHELGVSLEFSQTVRGYLCVAKREINVPFGKGLLGLLGGGRGGRFAGRGSACGKRGGNGIWRARCFPGLFDPDAAVASAFLDCWRGGTGRQGDEHKEKQAAAGVFPCVS